ncbi:cyclic nucleotide-binding protein [Oscillochloris trichoides DG-6]|uniref:Cyclic nucleotide-binding protein n=1 Tax=Oscillochloris trichoides DG-6 TaxID=765420 RepID=E1IE62_9CHLR|nr:Crp/Fnr family transcriptional regulator [Oscillochloris trichoides]EFO80522.1 cyclic nucleotide-binding protein [Oscillochloris trichoides DG-6]
MRPTRATALASIAAAPLFADLAPDIQQALAQAAHPTHYAAREVVFLAGERVEAVYLVAQGWLKAVKIAANGREQTVATFGPGATINDVVLLAAAPTQASLIALEPCQLWQIPGTVIMALSAQHPALAQAFIRSLATRILYLSGLVEDLAFRSVEARLARLILSQAQDGRIERQRWATQSELAAQIGTVPDVFNRALRSLVDAGLITVNRRRIEILDPTGLAARVEVG